MIYLILISIFGFLFFSNIFLLYRKRFSNELKGMPKPLPLLGNFLEFGNDPSIKFNQVDEKLNSNGIFRVFFGDTFTVILNDPLLVKEFLIDNKDLFLNRPKLPIFKLIGVNSNDISDGQDDEWKKRRLIAMKSIKNFKFIIDNSIQNNVLNLINKMKNFQENNKLFNPNLYLKEFNFSIIYDLSFYNKENQDQQLYKIYLKKFNKSFNKVFEYIGVANILDYISIFKPFYNIYLKNIDIGFNDLLEIVDKHYKIQLKSFNPKNLRNYLDVLINENLTIDEIRGCVIDLFFAGSQVDVVIEWSLLLLANNYEIQEKVYDELNKLSTQFINSNNKKDTPYTIAFCKEVLRFKPPTPLGVPRSCKQDSIVSGYFIPKDAQIITNIKGIHMNEKYWNDPNIFNPSRFLSNNIDSNGTNILSFLPWSIGERKCLGQSLSMDQIYCCISNIVLNFKIERPTNNLIDESESFGMSLKVKSPFNIKLTKR